MTLYICLMKRSVRTVALIVAAGSGQRLGGDVPKAYVNLHGKSLLAHAMEAFLTHPGIDSVRAVIARAHHPLYRKASQGLTAFPCVIGGATRQESVLRGLESLEGRGVERVLIHDAARPFVDHALITRVLEALDEYQAVLPALPVEDTIWQQGERRLTPLNRATLLRAQTPQGFHYASILQAHRRFRAHAATDDIALAEMAGLALGIVEGSRRNCKLTTKDDFHAMNQSSQPKRETRTGNGFDVHGFADHDPAKPESRRAVSLCGVKIPYPKRLVGNSDADVGLHALVDAILGAIGEGDIGMHFAAEDPKWSGADSSRFLLYAYQLLKQKSGEIVNLDVTIIGESPKVAPHREAMRKHIADLLKIPESRVNIKGCTTEKMGFLGRGEGLGALATATVTLPV